MVNMRPKFGSWAMWALAIILSAVLAAACAYNPVTGRPQLALISEEQEVQLGRQSAEQVRQSIGLVDNAALEAYVQKVGRSLAALSERPELPWSFQVVDDPTPNAFALPGGFIFVTRGMLAYMDSEAELAAVLGHEIGHVTARHSVQQISRQQLAQLGLGLGMIFVPELRQFGDILGSGLQLLFLKYGRDAERQADELGFRYALDTRYDVREMGDIFATLQKISEKEGRSPLPAWASTHPDPGERIEAAQARLAEVEDGLPEGGFDALRLGRPDFMAQVDGLVFGADPRHGYFKENAFLHPKLAFRIDFPPGWQTQNLPQAVVAGSPQKDAIIQLVLTQGQPEEAARQFLSQQGVQPGQAKRETVNDLPAVLARFAAQTQQGVVQGVTGFIAHGGRTYQIIGFAPASRYAAQERTFLKTITSFAPLRDKASLNVKPRRLNVVKIPRAMTLAEFSRQYPSVVDLETLTILNQVQDANTALAAGTPVKRVVEE